MPTPTLATESEQRAKAPELEVEQLTLERDRYADLFELAPDAYLFTVIDRAIVAEASKLPKRP